VKKGKGNSRDSKINKYHKREEFPQFINSHLLKYCGVSGIKLTRSKEYVSNDNPHVENRNMIVVRRYMGYSRYDTEKELNILKEL
jgi:hypothetical protein